MNIAEMTIRRLNKEAESSNSTSGRGNSSEEKLPSPVTDVAAFFSGVSFDQNNPFSDDYERYQMYKNNAPQQISVYDAVTLSNVFRECKDDLSQPQIEAFQGIESLREYIESINCNCQSKLSKINEYYRDFVLGNAGNDLFPSMKKALNINEIIFFHENQEIHKA